MSEWIKIEDKKPELGEKVLVFISITNSNIKEISFGRIYFDKLGKYEWEIEGRDNYLIDTILDWMPIPEEPYRYGLFQIKCIKCGEIFKKHKKDKDFHTDLCDGCI